MYIESPPQLKDAPDLYRYLYRLSEMLNIALEQVNTELVAAPQNAAEAVTKSDAYSNLQALIVNTAAVVRSEMDVLETKLESQYDAISNEFGTFSQNIQSTIRATAEDVVQSYGYDAQILALDEKNAGFEQYQIRSEGYIRQGFIEKDGDVPVVGIAIGQNLKATTEIIGGKEYTRLDNTQSCAFYTAEKVSFRIGGEEVAYVSNRKLYIRNAEITGSLTMGDWLFTHDSTGLTLQWIGG